MAVIDKPRGGGNRPLTERKDMAMEGEEYTGNWFAIENSATFDGQTVNVLEYKASTSRTQGYCFRCGKKLRKHLWTVQTAEDDLIICDIGNECVKHIA